MAILLDADRVSVRDKIAQNLSNTLESTTLTKAEWKLAVDATDLWISDNQTSFNLALPASAQTGLTKQQKARLFFSVAEVRFEVDI